MHNAIKRDYLYEQSEGDWETLWQKKTLEKSQEEEIKAKHAFPTLFVESS